MSAETIEEARRQIGICNACRYCEGYCSAFPAIHRERVFADADVIQLANLCHDCRGCYYACQYTEPHEFALNFPRALAEVRQASWRHHALPSWLARAFQRSGVAISVATVAGLAAVLWAIGMLGGHAGAAGFYSVLSHGAMVGIFVPAFLVPLLCVAASLRRYWRTVGGARPASGGGATIGRQAPSHRGCGTSGHCCGAEIPDIHGFQLGLRCRKFLDVQGSYEGLDIPEELARREARLQAIAQAKAENAAPSPNCLPTPATSVRRTPRPVPRRASSRCWHWGASATICLGKSASPSRRSRSSRATRSSR